MGIYIPDMDMPKSCWDCDIANGDEAYCPLVENGSFSLDLEGRLPDCPLKEIHIEPYQLEFLIKMMKAVDNFRREINENQPASY